MDGSSTTRRVAVKAFGGPKQLTVEPMTEVTRPGPGQLLVEVEAAGVNYIDVYRPTILAGLPTPTATSRAAARRVSYT